jgi:hypothetical protein
MLQYSLHTPTADLDQHSINMSNKCKTRIQRGLNYKPSGQENVEHPREVGTGSKAYGMKPMFRPGGRSIVKEWARALLDSECFICVTVQRNIAND